MKLAINVLLIVEYIISFFLVSAGFGTLLLGLFISAQTINDDKTGNQLLGIGALLAFSPLVIFPLSALILNRYLKSHNYDVIQYKKQIRLLYLSSILIYPVTVILYSLRFR
jgi:hypothetical protein